MEFAYDGGGVGKGGNWVQIDLGKVSTTTSSVRSSD